MNSFLRHYEITLTTCGPLFIGDGKELNKKEYILSKDGMAIHLIDIGRLYSSIRENAEMKESFEAFLGNAGAKSLENWLLSERLLEMEYLSRCITETIPSGHGKLNLNSKPLIKNFLRDAYGQPYVPGSSLKGMLRTVLLTERIAKDPEKVMQNRKDVLAASIQGQKRDLSRETAKLESVAFHTLKRVEKTENAVNDFLSGLRISDSAPLSKDCLTMCEKIDVKPNDEAKRINMERICIRPGTDIHFEVTIDTSICLMDAEDLMRAVSVFDDCCQKYFLSHFESHDHLNGKQVFLGGGAGFHTKTVTYTLLGQQDGIDFVSRLLSAHFRRHFHNRDSVAYGISPRTMKMTLFEGKYLPFGLCDFEIK